MSSNPRVQATSTSSYTGGHSAPGAAFDRINPAPFLDAVSAGPGRFGTAVPFPHVVLDDVLNIDREMISTFPAADWPHWAALGSEYERQKFVCPTLWAMPSPWREVIYDLQAGTFLRVLEQITGVPKLIPDPYLEGGGLHLSTAGGILAPHTDFHLYSRLASIFTRQNGTNETAAR